VKRWIGFRPRSATGDPHIGRVRETNVWLAYGHYRNGILLTPVTAARVADDISSA
jgi:glycine oxidase